MTGPRKALPQISARAEGLGQKTIMDRALAQKHGVRYVHLAVLAIDVDRVRDALEGLDDPRPFAWEVLLTALYLRERFDPAASEEDRALIEDVCLGVLEAEPGEANLGSQVVFAVHELIERGTWPDSMRSIFKAWRTRPRELMKALAALRADEARLGAELARACLSCTLEPPLAEPTREALERLARE